MPRGTFKKGQKRPEGAGRRPGSRNKKTLDWEMFRDYALNGGLERFQKELKKLKGRSYCDTYLKLLEFHAPKYQRVVHTDGEGNAMPVVQIFLPSNQREASGLPAPSVILDPPRLNGKAGK